MLKIFLGEFNLALQCYEKMLALDSSLTMGAYNRAALLLRMNRLDEAEKALIELTQRGEALSFDSLITIYSVQVSHS